MFTWLNFGIKDAIDIFLVALIIYKTYTLLRGTSAINVFVGVVGFVICWFIVSFVFEMKLLGAILDTIMNVGAIALIVIFRNEIRNFFSMIGSKRRWKILKWFPSSPDNALNLKNSVANQITIACKSMADEKCGALIVIERNANLTTYINTGEIIDAKVSSRLIENLFFKNSELHDGALIISRYRIKAAACILPISQNQDIPKSLGLRHRSALGMSERTDALSIVVSEETGEISLTHNGNIKLNVSAEMLLQILLSKEENPLAD